jgi:hypothetical protein
MANVYTLNEFLNHQHSQTTQNGRQDQKGMHLDLIADKFGFEKIFNGQGERKVIIKKERWLLRYDRSLR